MMTNSKKEGESLYAVAYWRLDRRRGWVQEISYGHARDYINAKARFVIAHKDDVTVWPIACGLAIAFFVDDKQGMVLSA